MARLRDTTTLPVRASHLHIARVGDIRVPNEGRPSGAASSDADAFPAWRGDPFVGTLAARFLGRSTVTGTGAVDADVIERGPLLVARSTRPRARGSKPARVIATSP